ncbi:MAG: hypothetical protein LUF30_04410 [Lachnospiraceae bacterium]|nr:hypothetical protein [Lachnospiraceae bacterium]
MIVDMPDSMARLFVDYRMNLVQVLDSDRYSFKNEDVKAVFDVSREFFHGNIDTVKERYRDKELPPDVVAVIGKVTESSFLMQKGKRERGPINMCTALEQWLQKEVTKGVKKEVEKEFKKGEKRGLEKGLVQRDRELILRWTAAGYQTAMIADLLGLSEEKVRIVQTEETTRLVQAELL